MEEAIEQTDTEEVIIDLELWNSQLERLNTSYQSVAPFPHIVLDNFLSAAAARKALAVFPPVQDEGWIHYVHVNEKKHGLNKIELLPDFFQLLIQQLNTPDFINWLSELTGIPNLKADDSLEGGGLHQSPRGGYLNVHADFTVHPHRRHWRRRVNLLLYFNDNWQPGYRGDLELWSKDMQQCVQKIAPLFNRCVIFNTDEDSFHGLPEPILCPEGETRKSLALYYFTEEEKTPKKMATNYRARPGDGIKAVWIYLDKQLIALYNQLKGWLGINDDLVSKLLQFFNRQKRK